MPHEYNRAVVKKLCLQGDFQELGQKNGAKSEGRPRHTLSAPMNRLAHLELARNRLRYCKAKQENPTLSYRKLANRFYTSPETIRKWYVRWIEADKSFEALYNYSNRPKKTRSRTDLDGIIKRLYKGGKKGNRLVRELKARGYKASWGVVNRSLQRQGLIKKKKNKRRRVPDTCVWFPVGWLQIDVKYVTLTGPYQYTATDCNTRLRFAKIYPEASPANSVDFVKRVIEFMPQQIIVVSTDNGSEFTYSGRPHVHVLHPLEVLLKARGIKQNLIPKGQPQYNGRVERSHRTDNEEFYNLLKNQNPVEAIESWLLTYNEMREHSAIGWITPFAMMEKRLKKQIKLDYTLVRNTART